MNNFLSINDLSRDEAVARSYFLLSITMKIPVLLLMLSGATIFAPAMRAHAAPTEIRVTWRTFSAKQNRNSTAEVKAIQFLLRARGFYKSQPDGIFGAQTAAAVKNFQRSKGLEVDGVVGAATFPKLIRVVKRGDRGDAVRAAQILGREATDHIGGQPYINLKVDGIYGARTEDAIGYFQNAIVYPEQDPNPYANGQTDLRTWKLMFGTQS